MDYFDYKKLCSDWSLISLVLSNIFLVYLFFTEKILVMDVILIYWIQSLIIGFFVFIKLLTWPPFPVDKKAADALLVKAKSEGVIMIPFSSMRVLLAFFFVIHYGIFHITYLNSLILSVLEKHLGSSYSFAQVGGFTFSVIIISSIVFLANHTFSFFYNRKKDMEKAKNIFILNMMFRPYARIIPMHFLAMVGFILVPSVFISFMLLKTIADVIMHISEHTV